MKDQLGTVMATYSAEVERLTDQSDRDTSTVVSLTSSLTAAEERAKQAERQVALVEQREAEAESAHRTAQTSSLGVIS